MDVTEPPDDEPVSTDAEQTPVPPAAVSIMQTNRAWESVVFIGLFIGFQYLGNRVTGEDTGLTWAIAAVTVWGVYTMLGRWRRGLPIGKFLPIILVALISRGALGIIFGSAAVYFGLGIATKVLIGVVLVGSVVVRKPLAGVLLPYVMPFDEATKRHPVFRSVMSHLSLALAGFYFLTSIWDVWLFNNASVSGFVLIRYGVSIVTVFGTFVGCFLYARRRLDQIPGFEGVMPMLERLTSARPDD